MSKSTITTFIKDFLSFIDSKIKIGTKNNLLDENILAESTFKEILNITFDLSYSNANIIKSTTKGIDLLDIRNKKYCQVTSDKSKAKVDDTINKLPIEYSDFHLYFLMLVSDAQSARRNTYNISSSRFDPKMDIIDFSTLFGIIKDLEHTKLLKINTLCKEELSNIIESLDFNESNLLKIIKGLSKNRLNYIDNPKKSFKYGDKIVFNNLVHSKKTIIRLSIFSPQVDGIYNIYDQQSSNISFSVIALIIDFYEKSIKEIILESPHVSEFYTEEDYVFEATVTKCIDYIKENDLPPKLPFEEIVLYANILVINAFLKCDIFENPEGYIYDTQE